MVYQPMLELLAYLRASGFKTFIVSGGGVEFMRPWTERAYGIQSRIGRRPITAFGNSDGDLQMRNGPPPEAGRGSPSSSITTTPSGSTPTIGPTSCSNSTRVAMRRSPVAGRY